MAPSKGEKKALRNQWKAQQKRALLLGREEAAALFQFLERRLAETPCDHTLRHSEGWVRENVAPAGVAPVLAEIKGMGGYCDCEVLLNCYEEYGL